MIEIKYVSDNCAIVCLKDMHSVVKNEKWGEPLVMRDALAKPHLRKILYVIEVRCEGQQELVIEYEEEQKRDDMYEKIRAMYNNPDWATDVPGGE